jgi:hypothetical protein
VSAGVRLRVAPAYLGVYFADPDGNLEFAGKGEVFTVRDQVEADRLTKMGAALAPEEEPEPVELEPQEPPRVGPGSSLEAWSKYADVKGLTVPEGATRDQVIALVDDARR